MVQEGLRKRLILPGGQYLDHVLHSFVGPALPLPFHAIAVEPVIRFCSTQVDFYMDAALAQAWNIGSISFQIALQFVYLLQIRLCTGMAGEKESINKIIAEHSAGSLSYKDAGTTSQNNSAITIDSLPNALGIVKKDAYHQMAGEYAHNVLSDKLTKKGMAEQQLNADEKSFADGVDRFLVGKISTDTIQVMKTPLVMRLVGAEVLPVEISVSDLKKVLVDKHTDITPDIMKQIPRALTDPMMIFSTYSGKNGEVRKVIVLELKDENGATIVVPMELERMSDGYKVNRMTSTYGKTDRKTGEPSYEWFKKQLEAGNLEYVNRKKATDWISSEQPHWLIPEEKVDNLLSAPNVANEEDLVKLKSENPTYYQTAADKDLVVYHNVSTGKLREAIKLGGLPMPSLAITKRDIPFGDFGEITLIGDKDMIDPRKSRSNEVFSRDAYTVRKPVVNYEVPAKIDSDAFHKKYEETRKFLNKNSIDVGEINFSFYDGEESLAAMENNIAIKYYYVKNVLKKDTPIKERTVTPPVRGERLFKEYPELIHALKSSKVKKGDFSEVDQAARPYFDEMRQDIAMGKGLVGRSKRVLAKWTTNGHINEEGVKELLLRLSTYEEDKKKKPYKEVDRQDFVKDLRKAIEEAGI